MNFARHIIEIPRFMEAHSRIVELRQQITAHDHAYYVLNAPTITDAEYDAVYMELKVLEARYPQLKDPNSPTQRVGGVPSSGSTKVKHGHRMLSLANTYSAAEVLKWFDPGEEILIEPKVDGLSLKLVYEKGRLIRAITRGNGDFGNDVTAAARTIMTVPLLLSETVDITVTGEVYMSFRAFNDLNARLEAEKEDLFANARNAAAGTLNLKDVEEVSRRKLSFTVHGCNTELPGVTKQSTLVAYLEILGFQSTCMLPVIQSCATVARVCRIEDEAQMTALIAELDLLRKYLNVATDGLVFKVNDIEKQRDLGEGSKEPNWAVAFKYPPERKTTLLAGITLQVGKTGKVTPVAEVREVPLSGTIVRRASLCNADEIERLNVAIGDNVWIEKSAEIIPKIIGVAKKATQGHYIFPEACPCCGTALVRPEGLVDWFCPNYDCDERVFQRLCYAVGKKALDIRGCGEQMVRTLMKAGVRKLSDLFAIEDVPNLKPAARKAFMDGREKAKTQPFWRQLAALNIEGLGEEACKNLAERFNNLLVMFDDPQALVGIVKNSEARQNLMDYMANETEELNLLGMLGLTFQDFQDAGAASGVLAGKIFAITGGLVSGSRDVVADRIKACGGVVKSNATSLCTHMVVGTGGGRIKAEKAEKYGIPQITEQELYALMGIPMPVARERDPNHEF